MRETHSDVFSFLPPRLLSLAHYIRLVIQHPPNVRAFIQDKLVSSLLQQFSVRTQWSPVQGVLLKPLPSETQVRQITSPLPHQRVTEPSLQATCTIKSSSPAPSYPHGGEGRTQLTLDHLLCRDFSGQSVS